MNFISPRITSFLNKNFLSSLNLNNFISSVFDPPTASRDDYRKLLKKKENSVQSEGRQQFFYGPPLSGAPFHSHGPAFNFLLTGSKQWYLFPPGNKYMLF